MTSDSTRTWDYIGTWAPDGGAYYFIASDGARPGWQLYRRDAGTGDVTELFAGDEVSLPRWSRNGTAMVWSVRQVKSQLWVIEFEQ
jgi:Tol biopolymer transport system component